MSTGYFLMGCSEWTKLFQAVCDPRATWRWAEKTSALQRRGAQEQVGCFTGSSVRWASGVTREGWWGPGDPVPTLSGT